MGYLTISLLYSLQIVELLLDVEGRNKKYLETENKKVPTLSLDDGKFIFNCAFAERQLAKEAGFYWDNVKKRWFTTEHGRAVKLAQYANADVKSEIDRFLIRIERDIKITQPLPENLSLYSHQVDAIRFALARNRCYLGLDPGLGKTIVAARIAAELINSVIVYICPPFLTRNTKEEFKKWAPELKTAIYRDDLRELMRANVLIIPDSFLIKPDARNLILNFISNTMQTILIVDEAHRYKTASAKRTKYLLGGISKKDSRGITDAFNRVIFMSGTPVPNRPMELYSILSKAAPETIDFMSVFDYGVKYCGGYKDYFGWDFSGASRVEELARRVIAPAGPFMLRLRKDLLKLPPKIEEVFTFSKEMSPKLSAFDKRIGARYDSTEDLIKYQLASENDKNPDEIPIASYRRLLGEEKVKAAVEYIESLLEETNENIIIFAYHKKVIEKLNAALKAYAPLSITGDTPMRERHEIVNRFQNGSNRLIIGNYQAMGVGFTLTKATRVIFVEFSWTPGENAQASDRAHRIGQTDSVLVQYMVYQDSIDKAVIDTLLRKTETTMKHI